MQIRVTIEKSVDACYYYALTPAARLDRKKIPSSLTFPGRFFGNNSNLLTAPFPLPLPPFHGLFGSRLYTQGALSRHQAPASD